VFAKEAQRKKKAQQVLQTAQPNDEKIARAGDAGDNQSGQESAPCQKKNRSGKGGKVADRGSPRSYFIYIGTKYPKGEEVPSSGPMLKAIKRKMKKKTKEENCVHPVRERRKKTKSFANCMRIRANLPVRIITKGKHHQGYLQKKGKGQAILSNTRRGSGTAET